MIKLGSENFPVTYLRSNNDLNLVSYCVSRKLISLSHLNHANVLEIQGIMQEDGHVFAVFSLV